MCLFFPVKPNRTFHSRKNELFIVVWQITNENKGREKSEKDESFLKQSQETGEMTHLQGILQEHRG